MRVSRTKCTSTFNDREERYSKCYSTFGTRKYRKSTSSTSFHSCGPESSPSQVPSKCASAPIRHCDRPSHPRRTGTPQVDSAVYSHRQVQNKAQAFSKRSVYDMARGARAVYGQEIPSRNTQGVTQPTADAGDTRSLHRARNWHCADEVYDPRANR